MEKINSNDKSQWNSMISDLKWMTVTIFDDSKSEIVQFTKTRFFMNLNVAAKFMGSIRSDLLIVQCALAHSMYIFWPSLISTDSILTTKYGNGQTFAGSY